MNKFFFGLLFHRTLFIMIPFLGFARSFGMRLPNGERREWIKPIMFSGGLGSIADSDVKKEEAETGTILTQCGNTCWINAVSVFTSITYTFPLLLWSNRNGSGEDRRAGVQDRSGWRSGLLCTSMGTILNHTQTVSEPIWCGQLSVFIHILVCRCRGTTPATGIWVQCREETLRWSRRWIELSEPVWKEAAGIQSAVYMIRGREETVRNISCYCSINTKDEVLRHVLVFR